MSVTNAAEEKPAGPRDQEAVSLKENVHSETVENKNTPGLRDEEEDPHVSFKTWVVVWVSTDLLRSRNVVVPALIALTK